MNPEIIERTCPTCCCPFAELNKKCENPPQIFLLQINRFSTEAAGVVKVNKPISVPEEMTLSVITTTFSLLPLTTWVKIGLDIMLHMFVTLTQAN